MALSQPHDIQSKSKNTLFQSFFVSVFAILIVIQVQFKSTLTNYTNFPGEYKVKLGEREKLLVLEI